MIILNELDKNNIQILGTCKGFNIIGFAYKIFIIGNQKSVWHYNFKLLKHPKIIYIKSNQKDGTIASVKMLNSRLERICKEEREAL